MLQTDALPDPAETEDQWRARYDPDVFARNRPSVAVDVVVLTFDSERLVVSLVRRTDQPEYGAWVLPGGFVGKNERVDEAAVRVLVSKSGLQADYSDLHLDRLQFFDDPRRDLRDRVLSLAYICRCPAATIPARDGIYTLNAAIQGDKAMDDRGDPIQLGFDHQQILACALNYARDCILADPVWPAPMLSTTGIFTVPDLMIIREQLGLPMTADALRRRVAADPRVVELDTSIDRGTGRRPPKAFGLRDMS